MTFYAIINPDDASVNRKSQSANPFTLVAVIYGTMRDMGK